MKLFHCGVDVTTNQWVYVEAENEQEAESLAKRQVREDNNSGHPVASVDVHCIHEDVEEPSKSEVFAVRQRDNFVNMVNMHKAQGHL